MATRLYHNFTALHGALVVSTLGDQPVDTSAWPERPAGTRTTASARLSRTAGPWRASWGRVCHTGGSFGPGWPFIPTWPACGQRCPIFVGPPVPSADRPLCPRLAVPRSHSLEFAPRRASAPPRPGVGHPLSPAGNLRGDDRISQVPGESPLSVCTCSCRRRQDCSWQSE